LKRSARPARDGNHETITLAFRGCGASVVDLSAVGGGCPDLLIGLDGYSLLVEVKLPAGPKGGMKGRKLKPAQIEFNAAWRGAPIHVVRTEEDVVILVKAVRELAKRGAA
jgi:hypothetical protein